MVNCWSETFNFANGAFEWYKVNDLGTRYDGIGWVHDNKKPSACWYRGVRIQRDFPITAQITQVSASYAVTRGSHNCNPPIMNVNFYALPNNAKFSASPLFTPGVPTVATWTWTWTETAPPFFIPGLRNDVHCDAH